MHLGVSLDKKSLFSLNNHDFFVERGLFPFPCGICRLGIEWKTRPIQQREKRGFMYRNLRIVPYLIFGRGSYAQLGDVLRHRRTGSPVVFMIDDVHERKPFIPKLPKEEKDLLLFVNVDVEPKTKYVDELTERVKSFTDRQPDALVGIGGGSTMDIAKAVSLMLANPGSSADYQGWDLVKNPAVFHVGIPTLAGTGAEVSRTAVLTGPVRKLGINSDYTPFDQIILDPDLLEGAPADQRFYTAMDSYIHGAEALRGTFINEYSGAYAEKSMDLCREVFLGDLNEAVADEKLMIASYFGGLSIAYSQVGVCHALGYGLSYVLGARHGIGNCVIFNHLEEYYPVEVREFREMVARHHIPLPREMTKGLGEHQMSEMIRVALSLDLLWQNALGPDWKKVMTPEKARELYLRM
jgi:3-deoxy-alpha-D-manno-octulosonate 8-oxidase